MELRNLDWLYHVSPYPDFLQCGAGRELPFFLPLTRIAQSWHQPLGVPVSLY